MDNKALELICSDYKLNDNDKLICSYAADHLDQCRQFTSRKLADETHTNAMTVVRLARKLGFSSYSDFIYNAPDFFLNYIKRADSDITENEEVTTVLSKITDIEINVIQKVKSMLKIKDLQGSVELISKHTYLDILALDTNAELAEYISHHFSSLGIITNVYRSTDRQISLSKLIPGDHVVLIISKSGQQNFLNDIMVSFHKAGIPMIVITGKENTYLTRLSTYTMYSVLDDSVISEVIFSMGVHYLLELLYLAVYSRKFDEAKETVEAKKFFFDDPADK